MFVGVAVGGGWQALVAYINLACYYVFGLPLGYILGYVADYGVMVLIFFLSFCAYGHFFLWQFHLVPEIYCFNDRVFGWA